MPEDKDEFWDKKLSVYTEKDEITKYESYREYPAIVKIVNNQPKVFLDIKFAHICHDFGRFLAFNNVESEEAIAEAKDFSDKLVKPIQGIVYSEASNDYNRDTIAKTFGMIFINNGFFHSMECLTPEKITELANCVVLILEDNGYLQK